MSESAAAVNNHLRSLAPLNNIYILQKDSKNVLTLNIPNKTISVTKAKTSTSFPHNFQFVNGTNGKVYIVGGGDYMKDEETLYNCWECDPNNNF